MNPVRRSTLLLTLIAITFLYALLWSPNWYPLSDSALYLNMARALARGGSLESVRVLHRDVRPLTPLLLAGIMKLHGGIGAMQAVMIALMVMAHVLTFLSLRRWFEERTALFATIATAASYWTYANAFTLMTEPLFLVMFWGAMLALGHVPGQSRARQLLLVTLGAVLMAGAWGNRVAAVLLLPGMIFGLWMSNRDVSPRVRAGWVAIFALVFAVLILDYRRPTPGGEAAAAHEETYHLHFFVGMKQPLDLPIAGGRWVMEALAAPAAVPFEMHSPWIRAGASVVSMAVFLLAFLGWLRLSRGRHWYAVGMALYFLPYLLLWGMRIKPRYMTPIAPFLFIQLDFIIRAFFVRTSPRNIAPNMLVRGADPTKITCAFLALLLAINAVPYAVEFYVRHGTSQNFYDVARRGAFAELVDIGAYVESHATTDAAVAVNWPPPSSRPPDAVFAPDRRIVQFLTDRNVEFSRGDATIQNPGDPSGLAAFFNQTQTDWAVIYYSSRGWPGYHLPFSYTHTPGPYWWQLFHRDPATGQFHPVDVSHNRDYVRSIPGWKP